MPYLFAYFRQVYDGVVDVTETGDVVVHPTRKETVREESLHYACSVDALHWTPLKGNHSVLPGMWLRDPYIGRGPDGLFHLLATGGGNRHSFQYASSRNLMDWSESRSVPVMANVPKTASVWAPEWVWDAAEENYFVYWSSSHGEHGWDDSRIWCARTSDFELFTEPQVLLDAGYTTIDATIIPHDGVWYMFVKDERFGFAHGEHRFVQVATAPKLDGPYTVVTGAVTSERTEGPAVLKIGDDRWLLIYDDCHENAYGASVSSDLLHWERIAADFPADARHGSVVEVSEEELRALQERFGE